MATPSKRLGRAPRSVVEQDFNAAIDRLLAGKPRNRKLRDLADSGRLSTTFANVALEAERSRSLIAHKNCAYQEVRSRIVALMESDSRADGNTTQDKIAKLRLEVAHLKEQLAAALDVQVESLLARERAEREANKWRQAFKRLKDDVKGIAVLRNA